MQYLRRATDKGGEHRNIATKHSCDACVWSQYAVLQEPLTYELCLASQYLQYAVGSVPPSSMCLGQSYEQLGQHRQLLKFWHQAEFDAITVSAFCNSPQKEVQQIQQSFLGKPVAKHGGRSGQEIEQVGSQ